MPDPPTGARDDSKIPHDIAVEHDIRCYAEGCTDLATEYLRLHFPSESREVTACDHHAGILRMIAL